MAGKGEGSDQTLPGALGDGRVGGVNQESSLKSEEIEMEVTLKGAGNTRKKKESIHKKLIEKNGRRAITKKHRRQGTLLKQSMRNWIQEQKK